MSQFGPGSASAAEAFEIQDAVSGGRHVLMLSGELDIASAPELTAILAHLSSNRTRQVLIDLSRLNFMDSSGLQALLAAKELCAVQGCEFMLVPGPRQVQRVFEVCGLLDVLSFETPEAGSSPSGASLSNG
jgi:anti-sigma B factor antagonist